MNTCSGFKPGWKKLTGNSSTPSCQEIKPGLLEGTWGYSRFFVAASLSNMMAKPLQLKNKNK
jgi:hypothetical protein